MALPVTIWYHELECGLRSLANEELVESYYMLRVIGAIQKAPRMIISFEVVARNESDRVPGR